MKRLIILACAIIVLSGCSDEPCAPDKTSDFEIQVLDTNLYGDPVEGAWIEGGVDWDAYEVRTDANGVALLPARARGRHALIHKSGYLARAITAIEPGRYWLAAAPMRLDYVAKVSDNAIRFYPDMLLTLGHRGIYRAFTYCDTSVTELIEKSLTGTALRTTEFYGDTLWYSTHNSGIFAYSVADPLDPVHLFSLDIAGYLGAFAVRDGFIAVGDPWGYDPVRVFSYTAQGETRQVAEVDAFNVKQMDFFSHYLVILSYDAYELPAAEVRVVDLSDPADPNVVYYLEEQWARGGLIHGETVLVGPFGHSTCMPLSYTAIDLSDPGDPVYMGRKNSDCWLLAPAGDSYAVGCYCPQGSPCYHSDDLPAVLERVPGGAWETVATLSRYWCGGGSVHAPPYFVLGSCLWRLRDR